MLTGVALFCIFLAVLVVVASSSQANRTATGHRLPPERAKITALALMLAGVGLIAYIIYVQVFP